jgi:hypothetical protein
MSGPGIAANAIVTGVRPARLGAGILALAGPTQVWEDGQWKKNSVAGHTGWPNAGSTTMIIAGPQHDRGERDHDRGQHR